MAQYKTKQLPHCDFYDNTCKEKECPSYGDRPKTQEEMQYYPVTDTFVHNWCFHYNKRVLPLIKIRDYEGERDEI
jgi:hypothetical protein